MADGDIALIDTLDFETGYCFDATDIIHVANNVYLIAYLGGPYPPRNGLLKTVTIESNGNIGAAIDTLEFEPEIAGKATLARVPGTNNYIVGYVGPDNDGWAKTFSLADNGTFGSLIDSWEYDPTYSWTPHFYHLGGTVWLVVEGEHLRTFNINANGTFGAVIAERDIGTASFTEFVHVAGDVFALCYTLPATADGYVRTWVIQSNGTIAAAQVDSLEFDTEYGYHPCPTHIAGNVYALNYTATGVNGPGKLITLPIENDGTLGDIGSIIDSFAYASNSRPRHLFHVAGEMYVFGYARGALSSIASVTVRDNGQIEEPLLDTYQYGIAPGLPRIIKIAANVFAFIYAETDNDYGVLKTFSVYFGSPLVTTQLCTDIADTTATGHGNVTDLGASAVTQHGHCWSEAHNPTIADDKTENGAKAATGAFTSAITGLTPETLYYVRAYATNADGTTYGAEVECTTFAVDAPTVTTQPCTNVQADTATGNGTLVDIGGSAVTQHGHVWATDPNPTTADDKTTLGARGVGVFSSNMVGLTPGATYYVRAYATNTQGTAYGDNEVLECPTGDIPVVTTQACSAIAPESATGHGNITSFGDDTPSQHGHCWSTSQYPTIADDRTKLWIPFAPGAFTSSITGLLPDTRYYIRAYATNDYGTAYGNQVSIFTYPGGAVINPANPVAVDWADDGVFVDISAEVMEEYIEFGKDRELNEATPSLLSLTLDNFSHKYSPPNASSPYNQGANSVRAGHRITVSFGYPFDDFDDVDGVNIVNHAVPKDSQFAWTEESGTFSIYDGKLRETGGSGGIAVIDFGEPDAHVQVDFTKGADNDCIIVFRYSDTDNYLYIKATGTQVDVRKVVAGVDTQVDAELLAWANGVTKTVKVILHGAYIRVVIEGTLLIKTSSTHNQAETEHGVGGPIISANARYDDFGGIYSLFYGTIDRIIPYPHKERQTALIEASDDLKILERHILYRRAYSYTGYPGGMRAFIQEVYKNTANVSQLGEIMDLGETIATSPLKSWWGISGLRVCRNAEREENGFFYQDQDSFWRFEAKGHRAAAPHTTPRCIFYQDYETNNLAFTGFKWASGEDDVFNMISVHVQKSQRDPLNLPTGGQEVWRCAEADVLDGGVTESQLAIPASSTVVIFFESKDFDCLVDLINPATASNVYKIEGKITDGPFLLGETVTGSVSGHSGKVVEQGGGYIILGDSSGAFNAADIWVGATSGATLAIGFRIEGTVANGPFLWGEGITTDVSGDTGIVREVGQGFVVLESCSGVFLAGDTLTGSTSAATMNGTLTITVIGAKTAIPDYQANAAADGSGADKTGNLTVVLSYPVYNSYGKGGKLALTNDDASPIYVTRLLVRGDGYHLKDMGSVYVEDATSKVTYGEHSYDVKAEILTSLAEAKTLADDVKSKEIAPRSKVEMTITNANKEMLTKILSLKLSDRITGNYSDMGVDEDFFINKIIYSITQGGLVVDAVLKLEEVS